MTPGMQFRLWLRTASRQQVALTAAVVMAVLALLLASVPERRSTVSSGDIAAGNGANVGNGASAGDGANAGALDGSSTGGIGSDAGGTAAGGSSGGGSSAAGGSGGGRGGASTNAGGSGGGSTATTTGFDIRKATDRGVNNCPGVATCVKVGFLIAKIGGLDQSGFALGLRGDIRSVIQAYVDDQNKKGGLDGRPIVPVYRDTDPVDQNDQLQACTEMANTNKVFAVIDTASLIFANTQQCFIRDNKTPLVHSYAESEAFMEAGKGYDVTEIRSLDRIAIEWADEIGKLKFLTGGERVGILEDNCEPSNSVVKRFLIGGIAKYKPASVKTYESDCTAASAQAQPPALQQQMCIDGVTHVLLATSFVAAQTFLQSADGGPCGSGPRKYKYMASDYSLLASDLFTRNFSKTQFDGSLAITNQFTGIAETSAKNKACSAILQAAKLPGVDNSYSNADAVALCDYLAIFVKASLAAGPNLTRAAWAQAVQQLGKYEGAFSPESLYAPNKTNGGELVHAMIWHADCTCYRASGPLHPGLG